MKLLLQEELLFKKLIYPSHAQGMFFLIKSENLHHKQWQKSPVYEAAGILDLMS